MAPTITISLQDILGPSAIISEDGDVTVATLTYSSKEEAIKGAKAAVRELTKYRLADQTAGSRNGAVITLRIGDPAPGLPETWVTKKARHGKPEVLGEIQKALEGYKVTYFNSSVNEGVVVADPRIPFGLQFTYSEADGLEAKLLKSAQVGGGKTWTGVPIDSAEQAVAIVHRAESLLADVA